MKRSLLIALTGALFLSTTVKAQLTIDAEVRPRGEYNSGYKKLATAGQDAVFGISQRTRLKFGYKSEWVDVYVSLQDIRMWGSAPQLTTANGSTTWLHQAYGVGHVAKWLDIKLGRQEIILDDHRIFGSVGWAQQARSHDAAVFQFKPDDKTKIDVGVAYNVPTTATTMTANANGSISSKTANVSTPAGNYRTLQYLWFNRSFGKVKASVLFLNNGKQIIKSDSVTHTDSGTKLYYDQDAIYFTQTLGARLGYAAEKIQVFGAVYYEMGNSGGYSAVANNAIDDITITRKKVDAILARLDVSGIVGPITLSGGYEFQSGNSQINPGTADKAFSPFYGTNHKFNGLMDYFYVGNHFGSVGLHDAFFGLKFKKNKFWTGATAHYFLAGNDVADAANPGAAMSSGLGAEIDFLLGYNINPKFGVLLGYSHLFATETLVALKGGQAKQPHNWGFLMITYKPRIFDSSNYQLKQKKES